MVESNHKRQLPNAAPTWDGRRSGDAKSLGQGAEIMHGSLRGSQNCITCLTKERTKRRRAARGRFLARLLTLALVLILVLSGLTACGGDSSGGSGGGGNGSGSNGSGSSSEESAGFKTPEFKGAKFHEDEAIDAGSVKLDVSHVARGYVAVSAYSDSRLKFQVFKGEEVYTYDLDNGGDPTVFPLTLGSGSYTFDADTYRMLFGIS